MEDREERVIPAAYAAGYFDAGGDVYIWKFRRSYQVNPNGRYDWRLDVVLRQNRPEVVKWFYRHYGGSWRTRYEAQQDMAAFRKSPKYTWVLKGIHCYRFLHSIVPYVQNETKQAAIKIGLQFVETLRVTSRGPEELIDEEMLALRTALRDQLRELTGRGRRTARACRAATTEREDWDSMIMAEPVKLDPIIVTVPGSDSLACRNDKSAEDSRNENPSQRFLEGIVAKRK